MSGARHPKSVRRRPLRRPENDSSPGLLLWLVMTLSVPLPWVGVAVAFVGVSRLVRGLDGGGWLLAGGITLVIIDIVIDIWLHRHSVAETGESGLNTRGARLVGRVAVLDRPLVAGRGRLQVGDSLWAVEGPDLPAGTRVQIRATRGSVLMIERVDRSEH